MAANVLGEDVMDSQREGGGLAFRGVHLFTSHIRQRSKRMTWPLYGAHQTALATYSGAAWHA
jgi:hypothetical protein